MAVLVSVVVPVYNAGALLSETVASVLAQTMQDFELILVDDGSSDGCLRPVEDLRDPRIRILRQSNQGAPAAMNSGVAAAQAPYVAFLDHDDLWESHKLEAQVEHLEAHPEADLCFSWSRWIDEDGRDLQIEPRRWHGAVSWEQLIEDFVIGNTSAIMVRREAIGRVGGFEGSLQRAYDQDFVLRVARLRPGNVQATPEVLTYYRRHKRQMSRHYQDAIPEWGRLQARIQQQFPDLPSRSLEIANSNMQRYFAWLAYEERHYWRAFAFVLSAFRIRPRLAVGDARNWLLGGASLAGALIPAPLHQRLEPWAKGWAAGPKSLPAWAIPCLVPITLLGLWQAMAAAELLNPLLVPSPFDLVRAAIRLTASGELPRHLAATLTRFSLGMLTGCLLGICLGTLLGMFGSLRRLLEPLLLILGSIPKLTLLPLVMLLLGINETARTFPVAASCFVILAMHALDAVRGIDGKLVQLARHYGAGPRQLFWSVYLPSALPSLFTGLRVATGSCLVITISVELLGSSAGLGSMIWTAYQTFSMEKLFLGIVLSALTGLTAQAAVQLLHRRLVPWKAPAN